MCLTILLTYAYHKKKSGDNALFILSLFALVISGPFFIDYVPLGNDTEFHLHRIIEVADCFKSMQFPPRVGIYGHITNIMYPNLFLWPSALLYCMRASLTFSYNFLLILITFTRVFLSYYSGKILLDNKKAILFSVVYSLNIYVFNNIYMRSDIGESLAMLFVPLYIAALYQFVSGEYRKGIVDFVISLSGIIQSHIVTTFLVALFTISAVVVNIIIMIKNKKINIQYYISLLIAGCATVVVNLWFIGPFLKYWNSDFSIGHQYELAQFAESALYPFEFFMVQNSIGVLNEARQGTVGLSALALLGLYFYSYNDDHIHKKGNVFAIITCIMIFLQSKFMPWDFLFAHFNWIVFISKIQYVTRFMVLGSVFMSLTGAIALDSDCPANDKRAVIAKNIKYAVILISVLYFFVGSSNYLESSQVLLENSSTSIGDIGYQDYSIDGTDYQEILYRMEYGVGATSDDKLTIVDSERLKSGYRFAFFSGKMDMEHEVLIPTLCYGLHTATLENDTEKLELEAEFDEETGLTKIIIPQGVSNGSISLKYGEPLSFKMYDVISAASIIAFILFCIIKTNINDVKLS